MYSRKSVGPRKEPQGAPAWKRYSCEDYSSRTTRKRVLLRKDKIRPSIWHEIP